SSGKHRLNLRQRGLSDALIDRNGYRLLEVRGRARLVGELGERFGPTLFRVPGFITKQGASDRYATLAGAAGMLIPVRDLQGRIVALKIRRDEADQGPRYLALSSRKYNGPGPGSPVHVPLGIAAPAEIVRLTEGELKADVALALSGLPTIAAP